MKATIDELQGLRDMQQSAWENSQKFWEQWKTADAENSFAMIVNALENMQAFTDITMKLIALEPRQ